jgi:hypothetical protein
MISCLSTFLQGTFVNKPLQMLVYGLPRYVKMIRGYFVDVCRMRLDILKDEASDSFTSNTDSRHLNQSSTAPLSTLMADFVNIAKPY